MSKNEHGKLLLLKQLEAMSEAISKGENIRSARVLLDHELDFVGGGSKCDKASNDLMLG